MGETEARRDERFEVDRVQRCPEPVQDPAHQAEVNPADDLAALAGEITERAVAQPDRIARVHGAVRRKAEIAEQADQASGRLGFAERDPGIRDHRVTPAHPGINRSRAWIRHTCELIREGPSQGPIRLGVWLVRVCPDDIAKAGSSASGRLTCLADDQTAGDQPVELLANRVRVESQLVSKLADTQGPS